MGRIIMKGLILLVFLFIAQNAFAWDKTRVIGGAGAIESSAVLEVRSTTAGSISDPKMTTTNRGNISTPVEGLGVWDTTAKKRSDYNGTGWLYQVYETLAATLTNKSIDSDNNTITNIVNADIKAAAAIERTKLASGTANYVLINNGTGVASEEQFLDKTRGGTGITSTAVFPASGTVVTEAGIQTITLKDIDGGTASNTTRLTVPKDTKVNLDALTRKEATLVYASDEKKLYADDGTTLQGIGTGGTGGGLDVFYTENFEENDHTIVTSGNSALFDNGGVLAGTLASEIAAPLDKTRSLKYTQAAGSLNDWVKSAVIPIFPKQGSIYIATGYSIVCTYDGAAGDLKFLQWDDTNNVEIDAVNIQAKTESTKYTMSGNFPSSAVNVAWGFQVLVANSGKILICDDIEYTTDLIKLKNLLDSEELFSAYLSTAQVITASGVTQIDLDTVEYDSEGGWDAVNFKYVVKSSGKFTVGLNVRGSSVTADDTFSARINVNGTLRAAANNDTTSSAPDTQIVRDLELVAGDEIEFFVQTATDASYSASGNANGSNTQAFIRRWPTTSEHIVTPLETVAPVFATSATTVTGVGPTTIIMPTEVTDLDNLYNVSTGEYISRKTGWYEINGFMTHSAGTTWSAGHASYTYAYINGTQGPRLGGFVSENTASIVKDYGLSGKVFLEVGDILLIRKTQDNGTTITLDGDPENTWFSIFPTGKTASLAGLDHLKLVQCSAEFGFDQAFDKQIGDCLDPGNELTDTSTGIYKVNFKSGYWADVSCSIDTIDEVGGPAKECKRTTNAGVSQVTGVDVKCADVNTTTVFDEAFSINCAGTRN